LDEFEQKVKERLSQLPEEKVVEPDPYEQISRLIRIFRLASLLPTLSQSSLTKLQELSNQSSNEAFKEYVKQVALGAAAFVLEQEKQTISSNPTLLLESLLDEIPLASALKDKEAVVFKDGRHFYAFVLDWQKKQFSKGICQCTPWGEALPPFTEGLRALAEEPFDEQLFYTYDKWLDALKQLNNSKDAAPQKQQQNRENEDLRELQEMQTLDKQKNKAKMQPIGEGMPW
jgi:hypothetical protein